MRSACCVLLAMLAIVVTACGDEGETGEAGGATSTREFAADADGICRQRIERLDASADRDDELEANAAWLEAYEQELTALRDVSPPEDRADRYREMLGRYEQGTDLIREYVDLRKQLTETDDRRRYLKISNTASLVVADSRRARSSGNRIAKELGLDTCSTPLY